MIGASGISGISEISGISCDSGDRSGVDEACAVVAAWQVGLTPEPRRSHRRLDRTEA